MAHPMNTTVLFLSVWRMENGKWGTSCRILWIDDLRVSGHQFIKPITERFGIGVYFYPGRLMPEEKIAELEKRYLEKERAEALEAEKRRIENERLTQGAENGNA